MTVPAELVRAKAQSGGYLNNLGNLELDAQRDGIEHRVGRLRGAGVDREIRGWEKASDHAPTWAEIASSS